MNRLEEECQFVGGPYDGTTISLPRSQIECALPVEGPSLLEGLQGIVSDLQQLTAALDGSGSKEQVEGLLDSAEAEDEEYAQPAPGGVLYRRSGDCSFQYVGHISVEELEKRQKGH